MKKLITASEIRNIHSRGEKLVCIDANTIITPSAKDLASELGISIRPGNCEEVTALAQTPKKSQVEESLPEQKEPKELKLDKLDPEIIAQVVREVIANMSGLKKETQIIKECDPSGVRLIRGNSVECETFETSNPKDKVGIKEILTIKESPNMATGFMTVDDTAFSWDLTYDEIDYVVEGVLEIIVNGKTYTGYPGDVFYIPRNTTVTFSSKGKPARFFFVTYPANWAELSGYQG